MNETRYTFDGDGEALDAALARHGVEPGAANRVRALHPYRVLASLLSQACHGDPAHAPEIVAQAARNLAVLRAAVDSAEAMIAGVRSGLGIDPPPKTPPKPKG